MKTPTVIIRNQKRLCIEIMLVSCIFLIPNVSSKTLMSAKSLKNQLKDTDREVERFEDSIPIPEDLYQALVPLTEYYFKKINDYINRTKQRMARERETSQHTKSKPKSIAEHANSAKSGIIKSTQIEQQQEEQPTEIKTKLISKILFKGLLSPIQKHFARQLNDVLPLGRKLYDSNQKRLASSKSNHGILKFDDSPTSETDIKKCWECSRRMACTTCSFMYSVPCC